MTKGNSKHPVEFMLKVQGDKITVRARVKSSKRLRIVLCILFLLAVTGLVALEPEAAAWLVKLFLSVAGVSLFRLLTAQS